MLDFVVAYLFYKSIGGKTSCMVKGSLFFPPLGWILRAIGGIPVDRKHPTTVVRSVLKEMDKQEIMHLAIAPEGTRKPVARWKTGYHFIATAANIPVYLCYFDWGRKKIAVDQKFELTDDAVADTRRIQEIYEKMNLKGRHPEKYITH
jgi:1-acyl-sn-glycerol-3-phosphate acyltransferase